MNLVDKQHIAGLQIGHQRGNIAGFFQHRPGGGFQGDPHFIGDDTGQGGFAQPRRTKNQGVIQRLTAALGGLQENRHLLAHHVLAHILLQGPGPYSPVHGIFPRALGLRGYQAICFYHAMASRL